MLVTIFESGYFAEDAPHYFSSKEDLANFYNWLADDPVRGELLPGLAPLRRVRWADVKKGKSKRSGLRITYLYADGNLFLQDVYGAEEKIEISPIERRDLRRAINNVVSESQRVARSSP